MKRTYEGAREGGFQVDESKITDNLCRKAREKDRCKHREVNRSLSQYYIGY